jgi:hypothetical protein
VLSDSAFPGAGAAAGRGAAAAAGPGKSECRSTVVNNFYSYLGSRFRLIESAFQTFKRHFKEPLLRSRIESGIQNENEHELAGEEIIGKHAVCQRVPPKEPTLSLPQQPRLTKIYFSVRASAKFRRGASMAGKNRVARIRWY